MNYKKVTVGIIVVWFIFALSASALHLFQNGANRIGLAVAIAALVPIIVFSLWYAASAGFRQFALSLDPRLLTSVQAWRIIGFTFVLLEARGILPSVFALPAGYGDMAIGATAAFVAWKLADPAHRDSFVVWQLLGILDLVLAVGLGTTAALISPQAPPMVSLTVLPLSLIPTFLVPLFLIFHVISIAQARTWRVFSERTSQATTPVQHPAI
jgi:membrane protein implicated in regulation of membrane protease activity